MARSVFEKLGGFSAVSGIVMEFYERVLDSDIVGDFFENTDMTKMIDHQTKFISSLLGGPASFTDEQLHQAHQGLEINDAQFQEVCHILEQTLADKGISEEHRQLVAQQFKARKMFIVC